MVTPITIITIISKRLLIHETTAACCIHCVSYPLHRAQRTGCNDRVVTSALVHCTCCLRKVSNPCSPIFRPFLPRWTSDCRETSNRDYITGPDWPRGARSYFIYYSTWISVSFLVSLSLLRTLSVSPLSSPLNNYSLSRRQTHVLTFPHIFLRSIFS